MKDATAAPAAPAPVSAAASAPSRSVLTSRSLYRAAVFPTAHTSSARLGSAHEAWDARASKAWQDIVAKEKVAAHQPRPSTTPNTHRAPVLPGRLAALAVPGYRPMPPQAARRPRSVNWRFPHGKAWSGGNTSPRSKPIGAYVSSAVH